MKYLACVLLCIFLASCGVKPDHLEPPSGETQMTHPRIYPNPNQDF